jgi:Ca2+-binding RTX toxin-like protein
VTDIENYGYTGSAYWEFDISTLGSDRILTGGSGSDKLTGGSTLDGGAGADQLFGGEGSTVYVIDNVGDKITETGPGSDEDKIVINRSVDLSDTTGLNAQFFGAIEDVQLTGTAALNVTGDEKSNFLYGNAGANILDGNGGSDFLSGGAGNDTYILHEGFNDIIEELAGGGIDTIWTNFDYVWGLDPEIENLVAVNASTGVMFVGNELNNTLVGTEFSDTLDGWSGDDVLIGGEGDDTYVVSSLADKVTETLKGTSGGIDTVQSWISYSIAGLANIENLVLSNPFLDQLAINGTGNAGANKLVGNDGDNILDGGKGIDTYDGGMGDDTFVIDNLAELANIWDVDGFDTVQTSLALTTSNIIADDNTGLYIENYVNTGSAKWILDFSQVTDVGGTHKLVGGSAADVLTGQTSSDYLDGGKGNDILTGGEGDDTYVVDSTGDVVVETGTTDYDSVVINRSVNLLTDFGGMMEFATLTGSAALNATGSSKENTLIGNDGANKLSGLSGFDTLTGGKGDDTLSGGADGDTFDYNALSDRGTGKEVINDFNLNDGDVLDFGDLLATFTYGSSGFDAFNAGALQFVNDGKGNTIVEVDSDGGGDGYVTLVTLIGATLTQGDSGNYVLE